jgi:hypothetical protein
MMKNWKSILSGAMAVLFVVAIMGAAGNTKVNSTYNIIPRADWVSLGLSGNPFNQFFTNQARIGDSGTALSFLKTGQVTFTAAATTSEACSVPGLLAGDKVTVSWDTTTTASLPALACRASNGVLTLYTPTDPGTTVTANYIATRY